MYVCMNIYVCVYVCRHVTVSTHMMEVLSHVLTSTGFCETVAFTSLTRKSSGYNLQLQCHFKLGNIQGSLVELKRYVIYIIFFFLCLGTDICVTKVLFL
jgi:hypothetical protein